MLAVTRAVTPRGTQVAGHLLLGEDTHDDLVDVVLEFLIPMIEVGEDMAFRYCSVLVNVPRFERMYFVKHK